MCTGGACKKCGAACQAPDKPGGDKAKAGAGLMAMMKARAAQKMAARAKAGGK